MNKWQRQFALLVALLARTLACAQSVPSLNNLTPAIALVPPSMITAGRSTDWFRDFRSGWRALRSTCHGTEAICVPARFPLQTNFICSWKALPIR